MAITLSADQLRDLALAHREARQTATAIRQPTLQYPGMTIDDSYAIQQAWVDLDLSHGARIVGHKIGLTSRAMQAQMQIDRPDFGVLLDDMVYEDGCQIDTARHIDPRIEVELAFVLARKLEGPNVTALDVLSATDYVVPALELIDARSHRNDPTTGRARTVRDTIADNAADSGIVTGGRPVRPLDVDLRWQGTILHRNGIVEETGLAAGVLGHPANGVAWLARTYHSFGRTLEAGHIVLAGSFTRAVAAKKGDTFTADYGPLGTVNCYFA
jgi:2-oxo-hept-3-ene-1,7-dioate hydratase